MINEDSLLSLTILKDFFQIAVYLSLFVLNGISCLILLLAIRDLKQPGRVRGRRREKTS